MFSLLSKRHTAALLATFIVVISVIATSASAGRVYVDDHGDVVIEVKVFQLPDPANPAAYNRSRLEVISAFKKNFRDLFQERLKAYKQNSQTDAYFAGFDWDRVRIDLVPFSALQVEGVETDLLAIAGGLQPDILYLTFSKSDNYIRNGFLYPLDKPEDGYWAGLSQEDIDRRVHPKILPVITRRKQEGPSQVWAMPYGGLLGKVLMYRKDLFDDAGIEHPDVDFTWEKLYEAAKAIENPRDGIKGMMLGGGTGSSYQWLTFLWSAGGEVMVYDEDADEWRTTFDSRGAAKALDFYVKLLTERWTDELGNFQRGYAGGPGSDAAGRADWSRGVVGMITTYMDEKLFATINPEVTGMVPVPLGPPDENGVRMRGGELNSRMMGLFAGLEGGGENQVVRDAAWEYMKWITSQEAERIRTQIMVDGGLGPFVNPKYLREFGYEELIRLSPPGWAQTFDIATQTGKPEPYGKNSNFAYEIMSEPIEQAVQMALASKLPEEDEARLQLLQGLLHDANLKAQRVMLGEITPRERRTRDITAWAVLAGIVISFGLVFRWIFKAFSPPPTPGIQKQGNWQFVKYRWAYVLFIPALLTIFVWQYLPLMMGSVLAFQNYKLMEESEWVGVSNFGDLLFDAAFWESIWNALRYAFLSISLTFLPPIILAILLQEVPHGKIFFRTVYYLPAVITGLVTVLLWKQFYEPSSYGTLNTIAMAIPAWGYLCVGLAMALLAGAFAKRALRHEMYTGMTIFIGGGALIMLVSVNMAWPILYSPEDGLRLGRLFSTLREPIRWLQDPSKAMVSCIIPGVWAGMGPGCLIYLAALKGIPDDYYEAADIDGATFIDKILFIVFPMLKPLIMINFIGAFIAAWFGGTATILAMTGGGANTEVVGLYIWYKAFTYLQMGPAIAAAWILGFMLIGFTVWNLRILSNLEFKAAASEE